MKLYTTIKRRKSIANFLYDFLTYIQNYDACYAAPTYFDEACTDLHCKEGKWRGFDDLLLLTKTYYPSITEKKLIHTLITMPIPDNYRSRQFGICNGAGILRFLIYGSYLGFERILTEKPHKSKYTWKYLFKLLKISNKKDYQAYVEKHNKKINAKQ